MHGGLENPRRQGGFRQCLAWRPRSGMALGRHGLTGWTSDTQDCLELQQRWRQCGGLVGASARIHGRGV